MFDYLVIVCVLGVIGIVLTLADRANRYKAESEKSKLSSDKWELAYERVRVERDNLKLDQHRWREAGLAESGHVDELNKKLITEIEARIDAEDANHIFASLICEIAAKKRSKKKG